MTTRVTFRKTDNEELIEALHTLTFPNDEFEEEDAFWVGYDETKTPVAFCTARSVVDQDTVFLSRSGVLPCARGLKLQRRMIRIRIAWARKQGFRWAITYVIPDNHPSLVNLIKSGFRIYKPSWAYAGKDVIYLRRNIELPKAHPKRGTEEAA